MAHRMFRQNAFTALGGRVVQLYPVVAVGANGVITLKKHTFKAAGTGSASAGYSLGDAATSGTGYAYGDAAGVRKVVRNSTGKWTFTLSDPYTVLIGVELVKLANTSGASTSPLTTVVVDTDGTNVQTNTATGDGGTIQVVLESSAGNVADPANGDQLTFRFTLLDGTVT